MSRALHETTFNAKLDLQTSQIRPRKGARPVVQGRVKELVKSISEVGLLSPIVVRLAGHQGEGPKVYELVAGSHRYAAYLELNLATIPATIVNTDDLHAELMEIDENLCRERLSPAQEASAVARRKRIYEELHPETAHGGRRKPSRQNGVMKSIQKSMKRFTEATAAATGRSERAIQRLAHRGEKIDPAALEQIVGTSLDKGYELDALTGLSSAEQERVINLAASGGKVSARPREASQSISSTEWRSKFKMLMNEAPEEEDCEWAAEQLARRKASFLPDIPPFLDRRNSESMAAPKK